MPQDLESKQFNIAGQTVTLTSETSARLHTDPQQNFSISGADDNLSNAIISELQQAGTFYFNNRDGVLRTNAAKGDINPDEVPFVTYGAAIKVLETLQEKTREQSIGAKEAAIELAPVNFADLKREPSEAAKLRNNLQVGVMAEEQPIPAQFSTQPKHKLSDVIAHIGERIKGIGGVFIHPHGERLNQNAIFENSGRDAAAGKNTKISGEGLREK